MNNETPQNQEDSYFNEGATQVRKDEISEKIQDNLVSEQSKRMDHITAEKAEKQQKQGVCTARAEIVRRHSLQSSNFSASR
jgi:hypothetical protein